MEDYDYIVIVDDNIPIRRSDNYISLTALCKAGNCRIDHYFKNKGTCEFKKYISELLKIEEDYLFEAKRGRYGFTWGHLIIGIHLAQWISPYFSAKVCIWVYNWRNMSSENVSEINLHLAKGISLAMHNSQKESEIRDVICSELKGEVEVTCKYGIIDIVTKDSIIEIKTVKNGSMLSVKFWHIVMIHFTKGF